jgi:ribosomal protein S18 acetylase RimI-like enzyme
MPASELHRVGEIDRSEHVTREHSYRAGSLQSRDVDIRVPNWSQTGAAWRPILERGGTLIGAFDAAALAGFAIYRPRLTQEMANLAVLHVSRSYRRQGVASLLTGEVMRLARADGARHLYVSATPSGTAVAFYRSHGFEPTDQPNAELFALEPDDIHMVKAL